MLKKIISLVAAGMTIFTLTACSNTKETSSKDNGSNGKEITIGISLPAADHGWLGAVIADAEKEAKAQGVKYIITTADNPNKQTSDIEDLITKNVSAIVMQPIESDPMTSVAEKIKAAHIPLVVFDREIKSDNYDVLVKGDNKQIGTNAAKYISKALGGKGKVVEITGNPSTVTELRTKGFHDELANYKDMEIITSQAADFQKEKALNVMQNILQSQKQIDAVYTQDDEMALGVLQAIQEAGRNDIKIVTGAGGSKDVFKLIKDDNNVMKATFLYSPTMIQDAVKAAVNLANGKSAESKDKVIPADEVNKDNVSKYYDENSKY